MSRPVDVLLYTNSHYLGRSGALGPRCLRGEQLKKRVVCRLTDLQRLPSRLLHLDSWSALSHSMAAYLAVYVVYVFVRQIAMGGILCSLCVYVWRNGRMGMACVFPVRTLGVHWQPAGGCVCMHVY